MITAVFPTLIHELKVDDFPSIKDQLIEFVYEEQRKDSEGNKISNIGGWQSNSQYNYDNILFNTIKQTVVSYLQTNKIFGSDIFLIVVNLFIYKVLNGPKE